MANKGTGKQEDKGRTPNCPISCTWAKYPRFYATLYALASSNSQTDESPDCFYKCNISDEPQCIDNEETREKLGTIADYFLLHNREIVNRLDDSVVRVVGDKVQIIRRARGYAPAPINLPSGFNNVPHILAMGSELKNTFCLLRDGQAIYLQHLGD
jgi:hydrogenase maturation factor HypF (carbamoyltransferase family)